VTSRYGNADYLYVIHWSSAHVIVCWTSFSHLTEHNYVWQLLQSGGGICLVGYSVNCL